MASFVRRGAVVVSLAIVLFSTSCEKHPIGQMPEVQREQPDPARIWSDAAQQHSAATPAEVPHETR